MAQIDREKQTQGNQGGMKRLSDPGTEEALRRRVLNNFPFLAPGEKELGPPTREKVSRLQEERDTGRRVGFEIKPARKFEPPPSLPIPEASSLKPPSSLAGLVFFPAKAAFCGIRGVKRYCSSPARMMRATAEEAEKTYSDQKRAEEEKRRVGKVQAEAKIGASVDAIKRITGVSPGRKLRGDVASKPGALVAYAEGAMRDYGRKFSPEELLGQAESGELRRILDSQVGIFLAVAMKRREYENLFLEAMHHSLGGESGSKEARNLLRSRKPVSRQLIEAENKVCEGFPWEVERRYREEYKGSKAEMTLRKLTDSTALLKEAINSARERRERREREGVSSATGVEDQFASVSVGSAEESFEEGRGFLLNDIGEKTPEDGARGLLNTASYSEDYGEIARNLIIRFSDSLGAPITSEELEEWKVWGDDSQVQVLAKEVAQERERFFERVIPFKERTIRRFVEEHFYARGKNGKGVRRSPEETWEHLLQSAMDDDSRGEMARYFLAQMAGKIHAGRGMGQLEGFGDFLSDAQTPGTKPEFKASFIKRGLRKQTPEEELGLQVTRFVPKRTQDFLTIAALLRNGFGGLAGTEFASGRSGSKMVQELGKSKKRVNEAVRREFLTEQEPDKIDAYMVMPDLLRLVATVTTDEDPRKRALLDALMFPSAESLRPALEESITTWEGQKDRDPDEFTLTVVHAAEASFNAVPPGWPKQEVPQEYVRALAGHFTDLAIAGIDDLARAEDKELGDDERTKLKEMGGYCAAVAAKWCQHVPPDLGLAFLRRLARASSAIEKPLFPLEPKIMKIYKAVATHPQLGDYPQAQSELSLLLGKKLEEMHWVVNPQSGELANAWAREEKKGGEGEGETTLGALTHFILNCFPRADYYHLPESNIPLIGEAERGLPDTSLRSLLTGGPRLQESVDRLGLPGLNSRPTVSREEAAWAMVHLLRLRYGEMQLREAAFRAVTHEAGDVAQRAKDARASEDKKEQSWASLIDMAAERTTKAAKIQTSKVKTKDLATQNLEYWLISLLSQAGFNVLPVTPEEAKGIDVGRSFIRVIKHDTTPPPLVAQIGVKEYQKLYQRLVERFDVNMQPVDEAELRKYSIAIRGMREDLQLSKTSL